MSREIKFRRYSEEMDLERLYQVYNDYASQINLTATKPYSSIKQFKEEIQKNIAYVYKDLLIAFDESNDFIGFVISYDYNSNDGTIRIIEYIDKNFRKGLYAGLICIKFIDTIFKYYSIRKVYSEVYGYNEESISCHRSIGFTQEGCFKEDHYYNNKYWDTYIFSFMREAFYEKCGKYVQ